MLAAAVCFLGYGRAVKREHILFGALAAALLAVTGYFAFKPTQSLPEHPLQSVPSSAVLVAHADMRTLVRTPVFQQLTRTSGDESIAHLRTLCGFNPLEAIREATLFVSEGGNLSPEHIGVVLRGQVGSGNLGRCLRRAVQNDGGAVRDTVIEGFPAVVSAGGGSRAVFVGDDGFVEGAEAPVLAALHAASGAGPAARGDAILADLWEKLGANREISVFARVPQSWHDPLTQLATRQNLPALSHVVGLGIGLRVANGVTASAIVRADSDENARALLASMRAYKEQLIRTPFLSFTPFGGALQTVQLEAQGHDVVLAADLSAAQLQGLIEFITADAPQAPPTRPTPAPIPTQGAPTPPAPPPEVIAPRPSGDSAGR